MTNEEIIKEVFKTLESRRDAPIDSYTSNLMIDSDKQAEDKILEKIGEEAAELIIASKNNENLVGEATDLVLHILVLLVYKGVAIEELFEEFERRHR